jgi:predicted amidohydrolase
MREAKAKHARLIHFPEGMLSGYAKNPILDWEDVDWDLAQAELTSIMQLAGTLKLWVALGSAHRLIPPHWPHNSLYIISDEGTLINRYDKRIISHTEVTRFYTAGYEPVTFDIDGYRFGCAICIEVNFPEIFMEYGSLGIDCLLFSAYPVGAIFSNQAQAHAANHNYWISLSTPTETASFIQSSIIGPNGEVIRKLEAEQGVIVATLDRDDPAFDIALNKAKPWRASILTDPRYNTRHLNDPRSINRLTI